MATAKKAIKPRKHTPVAALQKVDEAKLLKEIAEKPGQRCVDLAEVLSVSVESMKHALVLLKRANKVDWEGATRAVRYHPRKAG